MKAAGQFCLAVVAVILLAIFVGRAGHSLDADLPKDMPSDARFLRSGYDLNRNQPMGSWVVCRIDDQQNADWCRVTDQRGVVVFEGDFLPVSRHTPVESSQLAIADMNPNRMWVKGPAEQQPVPVITLINRETLVPIADRDALVQRWAEQPDELARVSGGD